MGDDVALAVAQWDRFVHRIRRWKGREGTHPLVEPERQILCRLGVPLPSVGTLALEKMDLIRASEEDRR